MSVPKVNLQYLTEQASKFDYLRFTWSDVHGIARGKTIPACQAVNMLESGVGCLAGELGAGLRAKTKKHQTNVDPMFSDVRLTIPTDLINLETSSKYNLM